ncbi:prolyl hydroxylase family protein [Domibacillus aminovorans]|uniref:2OG-Fe(II) oxygenase n=1 Tax=Domibacillus aminovorans TaxID=29332 RepID=A0A177L0R9_9BACI|nr:2OG-Fe(II) oxygenase [Domibacillus aminovorans]OAH59032.1 2OG-Fe(II) oxygenase [Domibacillus aminovorans]
MKKPAIVLCDDPFIACYEQVVTEIECLQLRELARNQLKPATIIGPSGLQVSNFRISDSTWFSHDSYEIVRQVSERMASIIGKPLHHAEKLQIARYKVGGKFGEHLDCYDPLSKAGKHYIDQNGQRLYTALLYLNTVKEGGETFFSELNVHVTPSEGTLLIFENCKKNTNESNPLSRHGARPVNEGEKWIATLWFCEKPQY